jgi:hypothetical protein
MMDFAEIAKNIELAGTTVKQKIDKLKKDALSLPDAEKDFLLGSLREMEDAIKNEDMAALLKTMNNDPNSK